MSGIVEYDKFVKDEIDNRDLKTVYLEHIDKAVSIMGIDNVSVSSDDMFFYKELFNEEYGQMVFDYSSINSELRKLLSTRYSLEDIDKIMYRNISYRVF